MRNEALSFPFFISENWILITALLGTEYWTLNTAKAKDFATHGTIYSIEEQDPIALIQQKLKRMEERGELAKRNRELQSITKAAVERPKPVEGITKTQKNRTFYFDPSYVVSEDLKDHRGKVFATKGTKLNPLETISLSHNLLLFDGDDPEQKEWARQKLQNGRLKLILVKGAPLSLSEELNVPVYFDQGGLLTKKLGIRHVPALVTQDFPLAPDVIGDRREGGLRLRLDEYNLKSIHYNEQKYSGKIQMKIIFLLFLLFNIEVSACPGRFVNPITDICWSCLFPISIGPTKVNKGGREDTKNPKNIPCLCPKDNITIPGIPIGFWEPARLVDITRIPFCMVSMGGIQLGKSIINHGVHGANGEKRTQSSFYQVHWYIYPVIYWLELLVDFLCLEKGGFDVGYITELDPLWNEDELSFILNPEAVLFGNSIAQSACSADCAAATIKFPLNELFWCGGCQGSLYPFTGNNAAHIGGVQASLLMAQRLMAKLHRELLLWGTSGTTNAEICNKYILPIIKKTQYKTQMTYPRPTTRGPKACNPLGRTEVIWGEAREFPYKGEDFGYLIWRKRNCCLM